MGAKGSLTHSRYTKWAYTGSNGKGFSDTNGRFPALFRNYMYQLCELHGHK